MLITSSCLRNSSRKRYFGALSKGKASTFCCAVHSALGWDVEVADAPGVMCKYDKYEQNLEPDGVYGEEVY